jgi:hypothetical protein
MTLDVRITDGAVDDRPSWSAPLLRRLDGSSTILENPGSGLDGGQDSDNES